MAQKNNYIVKKNHEQKRTYCRCWRSDLKVFTGTIFALETTLTLF